MTTSTRHTLNSAATTEAWDDATAWAAECDRRDAERAKPYPVITPCLLAVFALAVFAVGLAIVPGGL